MRIRLKGINRVRKRLATGQIVTYFYAWKGGPRLDGEPGTAEFLASYNRASRSAVSHRPDCSAECSTSMKAQRASLISQIERGKIIASTSRPSMPSSETFRLRPWRIGVLGVNSWLGANVWRLGHDAKQTMPLLS